MMPVALAVMKVEAFTYGNRRTGLARTFRIVAIVLWAPSARRGKLGPEGTRNQADDIIATRALRRCFECGK